MKTEALKLALEALENIANKTYDSWTNGAEAGRIAQTTLLKIKNKCRAIQTSDQMTCECGNVWDMNDPYPPKCTAIKEALAQPEQEPENRCVRELREFAKSNQGAYIFPSWDGNRVLKYLGDTTPPQRTWVGLTDEMVVAAARVLNERQADACGVDRDDQWAIYSDDFKADALAMLKAAHGIKENT